jgi:uncharacterized SAM-binding protein YcdF (DUF218 family)
VTGLLHFIFSTSGAVWALSIVAIWAAVRPRSGAARRSTFAISLGYLLACSYIVPAAITALLARPFHEFRGADVGPGHIAVVVLGAGKEDVPGWDDRMAVSNTVGASRVLEAWRVYQLVHPDWVISSGGNLDSSDRSEPSSVNMRKMLVQLGVPESRIILESTSRETHENALLSADIVRSLHADSVVLVTSASHMRRSIGAMRAAGIAAVPAIAPDSWLRRDWDDWLFPSNHALYFSGEVAHELLGIPYYRVRGWSR